MESIIPFYSVEMDVYATLLQLGLAPLEVHDPAKSEKPETRDVATQTEKPSILWGYF